MIKSIINHLINQNKKTQKILNWDNCNPEENGEKFVLKNYAHDWKMVFDIGSSNNIYSTYIREVNSNCKIHCFEPNTNYKLLTSGKNIIQNQIAVDDESGYINININKQNPKNSSIFRKKPGSNEIKVKSISLDDYIKKNKIKKVNFIKIDTEGNEVNAIKGMNKSINKNLIDMIQFEYGGTYIDANRELKDVYRLLNKNFIIAHIMPRGLIPINYSKKIETFRYSNWLAISRKYGLV